jgi:hypothetical protein
MASKNPPAVPRRRYADFCNKICHERTHPPQCRLVVRQIAFAGWIAHRCLLGPCALRPLSLRQPQLGVDGCYEPFNLAVTRIIRKLAPGGLANHGRPRNAVSPIRNCQNRRMARDLPRKGRAHNSGSEPRRLRRRHAVRLRASQRANRQSLRPRQRQQMSSSFQAPLLTWRAATRPPHYKRHQEIPAAAFYPPAGHHIRSTECIDRGWLRVGCLQSPDVLLGSN